MSSAGGAWTQNFRGNSPYDPDSDSALAADRKATGFDLWAAMYNRYTAVASKIEVTVNCVDAQTTWCYLWADRNTTAITEFDQLRCGQKGITRRMIPASHEDPVVMSNKTTTKSMVAYMDNTQVGDPISNPINVWFWRIIVQNDNAATVNGEVTMIITYDVIFHDPKLVISEEVVP